jgi:hypothetical protein
MDIFAGYQPEEKKVNKIEPGDHRLKIESVVEKTSRGGNQMLEMVLVHVNGMHFKYYLVKGEYFNSKLTAVYDCFGIPRGDKQVSKWVGKVGTAHLDLEKPKEDGGQRYLEIKYFISAAARPAQADEPKPFEDDSIPF